jgi:hypothetical protein
MTAALIGYTGFVGGNLLAARPWDALFNSQNFRDMTGQTYDLLVCAGVSAVKWQANREPEADWAGIQRLIDVLATVKAKQFVLISTVDVFPQPGRCRRDNADASGRGPAVRPPPAATRGLGQPALPRLPCRSPARLFWAGPEKERHLRLLHDNMVSAIDPDGVFQFYDVRTDLGGSAGGPRRQPALVPLRDRPRLTAADRHGSFWPAVANQGPATRPLQFRDAA